ncbi:hypothetical protein HMPREF3189_00767 [Clostridiales bacterium KA00134]|nr:hypothetical protein HMPREF3189_00767 [Clostridiales bacterium KA00134]
MLSKSLYCILCVLYDVHTDKTWYGSSEKHNKRLKFRRKL